MATFFASLKRKSKTIGFRLVAWYSLVFIVSSLALFGLAYFLLSASLERKDRETIEAELKLYASRYESGGLEAVIQEVKAGHKESSFVRVAGSHKETLYVNLPSLWEDFDVKQLEAMPIERNGQWLFLEGKREGEWLEDPDVLEVLSVRLADGRILQTGKSSEERGAILENFQAIFAVVTMAVLGIGLAGGAFWAKRSLRPLRDLAGVLRSIQETSKIDARVPTRQTGDELDELAGLFNALLETIESLVSRMRGALDDVAHDLRTPLTRLRGAAEIALRSNADNETYRQALAECLEQSEQTLVMLNTLMDVAEAEAGTMKLDREQVDIRTLVQSAVGLYEHVAEEEGVAIHTEVPEQLSVWADGKRLRQAVANLLDNAIKYNRRGGSITIEAHRREQQVVITVRDTGIGIAPEELTRIWDRLYRGQASRDQRGLGLGLSLVRAVALAHKGSVEARSEPGQGSELDICLPAGGEAS